MKVAIITDTHWGARNESLTFNNFFCKFYDEVFFPYLFEHDIKQIIHLGDMVDRRKFLNYVILNSFREKFIERIVQNDMQLLAVVGNHDVPYRNTNEINAMKELFGEEHPNILIVSEPTEWSVGGLLIAFVPWINHNNHTATMEMIQHTKAKVAMGHLELAGFQMHIDAPISTGMDRNVFDKFKMVFTGHFHHKSTDGKIFYLGNPYEITWADHGDRRGFHIFNTETLELKHIENPFHIFHKIDYDDEVLTLNDVMEKDFSKYQGCYIKVNVLRKTNVTLFDHFIHQLQESEPIDVMVIEDFTEHSGIDELMNGVDQSADTLTILTHYLDNVEVDVNREQLKNTMRKIYVEAQELQLV